MFKPGDRVTINNVLSTYHGMSGKVEGYGANKLGRTDNPYEADMNVTYPYAVLIDGDNDVVYFSAEEFLDV